jgi:aspartate aminotransferase
LFAAIAGIGDYSSGVYLQSVTTLCLSSRAAYANPSPTLAMTAKANALKASGADVISFAAGEPDFATPEPICQAAHRAIDEGFTKYCPTAGIKELREAIAQKLHDQNGIPCSPDQVVVSCGAKHSLYNSAQMLISPGDEVLLIAPYWMTYYDQIQLAGGVPVVARAEAADHFIPNIDALKEKISPRTRAIFLNTPCNPTGAVYGRKTLEEIASLALRHDLWIVCDEIYEKLVYGQTHISIASLGPEVAERTVTVGGCSKSFAMTGWRIGYAAAPQPVAKAMSSFQDSVTSNPTSFAQKGALEAFKMPLDTVEKMRQEFETRRDLMRAEFLKVEGLDVPSPGGAFYFLVCVQPYLNDKVSSDHALAEVLLDEAGVATVPGTVFDAPGYLRVSYTASRDNIKRGVARIADVLAKQII